MVSVFENHLAECEYSNCIFCEEYYPNSMIGEHISVCDRNPDKNEELNEIYNNYGANLQEEDDDEDDDDDDEFSEQMS